jgi:hypothetical protein
LFENFKILGKVLRKSPRLSHSFHLSVRKCYTTLPYEV